MKNSTEITYVAMDVHKKQHSIAMILPGSDQVTEWTIHNNDREIKRMVKRLEKVSPGQIEVCYEAGVCGFALQRKLSNKRIKCMVFYKSLHARIDSRKVFIYRNCFKNGKKRTAFVKAKRQHPP